MKSTWISSTSKPKGIKICSTNINGIRGKKLELQSFLDREKPDILAVQETKIDDSVTTAELFPSELGYSVFRKDRILGGGGVLLAIQNYLKPTSCLTTTDSESIWAKIQLNNNTHYFCSFYRPEQDEIQQLRNQLESIGSTDNPPGIHILGDFNYNKIDWTSGLSKDGTSLSPSDGLLFVDIIRDFYLDQLITFPTRGPNTLDLLITNRPGLLNNIYSPNKFSDHDTISSTLVSSLQPKVKQKRKVYQYSKANVKCLNDDMSAFQSTFLKNLTPNMHVDELWNLFKNALQKSVDKNVPSKVISPRDKLPWMSNYLRRLIRRRDRLHARAKKTGSIRLYNLWKKVRRKTTKSLKTAHDNYVNNIVGNVSSDSKPFWKYIKAQRKDNQDIPPLRTRSGDMVDDNSDKVEVLNSQFVDNFSEEMSDHVPLLKRAFPIMPSIYITIDGVEKLLNGLKTTKTPGPDEIHPRILKETASQIAPVLTIIFQKSMESGSLPKDWQLANICPIFKKGDRSDAINYRPVSLTSVVCKLLEHIIATNIMHHVEKHGILTDKQHAFRKNRSCTTQLCTVVNDLTKALDLGFQVDLFVLDFAKAFDKVPHERLKTKLHHYGIDSKTLSWIDSFLCERMQRVVLCGHKSSWSRVTSSVPQGTVLGPLLFNLFINDITDNINSEIRLFADDCVCYNIIKSNSDCENLQSDINKLALWAKKWSMSFQTSKCKTMRISRKTKNNIVYLYSMQDTPLETVTHMKYLGVTISCDLRWNRHTHDICNRANKMLGLLRRNLYSCNRDVKLAAYHGLIRPILEYASPVWDPHTAALTSEIEKVQRRAARFISSNYITSFQPGGMTEILRQLKLETLEKRRKIARLTLFNQGINKMAVLPLNDLQVPTRRLRNMHAMYFRPLFARTNIYKFSFLPRTIIDWNEIPQNIIEQSNHHIQFVKLITTRQ